MQYHVALTSRRSLVLPSHMLHVLCMLSVTFGLTACKSTPDKESAHWREGLVQVEESIRLYPNFATVLTATRAQATKTWKSAEAISDPKAQLEKMKVANDQLRTVNRPLRLLEIKLKDVERDLDRLTRKRLMGLDHLSREKSINMISSHLSGIRGQLTGIVHKDPIIAAKALEDMLRDARALRTKSSKSLKRFSKSKSNAIKRKIQQAAKRKASSSSKATSRPKRAPKKSKSKSKRSSK